MVYGDFESCSAEMIAEPDWGWRWRGLGERDFTPGGPWIGLWLLLISGAFALILAKGAPGGICRNGGIAA
jgi:hypothetical protein